MEDVEVRWYHLALCKGMPLEYFYDEVESDDVFLATMKSICASCPVKKQCLEDGISNKDYGLWGGELLSNGNVV